MKTVKTVKPTPTENDALIVYGIFLAHYEKIQWEHFAGYKCNRNDIFTSFRFRRYCERIERLDLSISQQIECSKNLITIATRTCGDCLSLTSSPYTSKVLRAMYAPYLTHSNNGVYGVVEERLLILCEYVEKTQKIIGGVPLCSYKDFSSIERLRIAALFEEFPF